MPSRGASVLTCDFLHNFATVATLGLMPFLFVTGAGAEVQRPLAIVVICGLITSTLLTIVASPALNPGFQEPRVEA